MDSLGRALAAAMRPRVERLDDEHHPEYLHPARTVLILIEDIGITDPAVLCAGALVESLRPVLAADPVPDADALPPGTLEILAALEPSTRPHAAPIPTDASPNASLAERLVAAPAEVRIVALAERLDHDRHLHLGPPDEWLARHTRTVELYLPLAERTHPILARRFRWWCRTFGRRFLGSDDLRGPHDRLDARDPIDSRE